MTERDPADLAAAAAAVSLARGVVDAAAASVAARGGVDANQVVAYDLAHAAAGVAIAGTALGYGALGDIEGRLACAFVADMVVDLATKVLGREADWGTLPGWSGPLEGFLATWRRPELLAGLCGEQGPRHLSEDFELVRTTFHRFAEEKVRPHAEHVHRSNDDVPEEIILGHHYVAHHGLGFQPGIDHQSRRRSGLESSFASAIRRQRGKCGDQSHHRRQPVLPA